MIKRRRRRRSLFGFALLGVLTGVVALIASIAAHPEAVRQYWATASIDGSGTAHITETIDYHFPSSRHGIYRVLPDLAQADESSVTVSSDTYDGLTILPDPAGTRLRIGDPAHTVSGDHRYVITYVLRTLSRGGDTFSWNAVGTQWTVPVQHAEIDLVAPWSWEGVSCDAGSGGSYGGCTASQPEPGHLVISYGRLTPGHGLTVSGRRGAGLAAAPAPRTVTAPPTQGWLQGPFAAFLVALAGVVVAAVATGRLLRRAGRDWVGAAAAASGDAAGLAWNSASPSPGPAGVDAPGGVELVDDAQLESFVTTEFAPPTGITPWQGGVVSAEGVRDEHKVAWLVGAAVDGYVSLDPVGESSKSVMLHALPHEPDATTALLGTAFAWRSDVMLGTYDSHFSAMWQSLPSMFRQWLATSGLQDAQAEHRVTTARVGGVAAVLVGAAGVIGGAIWAASSTFGLGLLGVGAVLVGMAIGLFLRSWELRRRTPAGSALWLRVESFRRFLANSEGFHAAEAAKRNVLREYTAWAVALGEVDHWSKAVAAAGLPPDTAGLNTVFLAPALLASTRSTAVAPSSSGGGGGGGVGGGGGGGGGGSW